MRVLLEVCLSYSRYKYSMRINEDYIDIVDKAEIANNDGLSMEVRQNVQWLLDGLSTNINLNIID